VAPQRFEPTTYAPELSLYPAELWALEKRTDWTGNSGRQGAIPGGKSSPSTETILIAPTAVVRARQDHASRRKTLVRRSSMRRRTGEARRHRRSLTDDSSITRPLPGPRHPRGVSDAVRALRAAFPDLHVASANRSPGYRVVTRKTFKRHARGEFLGLPDRQSRGLRGVDNPHIRGQRSPRPGVFDRRIAAAARRRR